MFLRLFSPERTRNRFELYRFDKQFYETNVKLCPRSFYKIFTEFEQLASDAEMFERLVRQESGKKVPRTFVLGTFFAVS